MLSVAIQGDVQGMAIAGDPTTAGGWQTINELHTQGLVTSEAGRGVIGASVSITDARGIVRHTQTDADGIFRVVDLTGGVYQLSLEAQGYEALKQQRII